MLCNAACSTALPSYKPCKQPAVCMCNQMHTFQFVFVHMQMHKQLLAEVEATAGKGKVMAVVMDNPKANRKACQFLEEDCPNIIAFGCQVHSLNLLCKVRMRKC